MRRTVSTTSNRLATLLLFLSIVIVPGLWAGNTLYVSLSGSNIPPYDTWAKAATNIQNAVNATIDGDIVLITNGTYRLASQITITNGIRVCSVQGWTNTIVDGNNTVRGFFLSHSNGVIGGLTITRGLALNTHGGGVFIGTNGTVRDCAIISNTATYFGGGVECNHGGLVSNCIIIGNASLNGSGGGICCDAGGTVQDCLISSNQADYYAGGVYCRYAGTVRGSIISNNASYSDGGGIFCYDSGTISDCAIVQNTTRLWGNGGGIMFYAGGTAQHCRISGNLGESGGGVYCQYAGVVQNCLITGNTAGDGNGGGAACDEAGDLINCTIASNTASEMGGGLYCFDGGYVENTIIYCNQAPLEPNYYNVGSDWFYTFCCTTPSVEGNNNSVADPQFVDAAGNDFHLLPGSPCVNAGTNEAWMAGAQDLDGCSRIIQGIVDLGAYELNPTGGTLRCNAIADVHNGIVPLTVNYTAYASGTNTTLTWYGWDFNNDGTLDQQGASLAGVSHVYSNSGWYSISLTVSNAAGEGASITKTNYIQAGPATAYVALGGSHLFPYTNWATAATNVQAAVDAGVDGTLVLVTNGTYALSQQISVTHGITLRGLNGATNTVLDGGYPARTNRCVFLNHTNVVLEGFTITRGNNWYQDGYGAGVCCWHGGTVQSCIISSNNADEGAGVYCRFGGWVQHCTLIGNSASDLGGAVECWGGGSVRDCVILDNSADRHGGGIQCYEGGSVQNCIIAGNSSTYEGYGGGVDCFRGGTIRNCVLYGNTVSGSAGYGGGIYILYGGEVQNCTICSNTASQKGGGVYANNGGTMENTVIFRNSAPVGANYSNQDSDWQYSHCCTVPAVLGINNIAEDPDFSNPASHNYRLLPGSPCLNVGTNEAWMSTATDLDGNDRILDTQVDIGAYEFKAGALICNAVPRWQEGVDPLTNVWTAFVAGTNTDITWFGWDFNNDGSLDQQGSGLWCVTNVYSGLGTHSISLTVSNAAGEGYTVIKLNYIQVGPPICYVAPSSSPTYPYTNWITAATNIQDAVNAGVNGTLVLVTNGTYALTSMVSIVRGITVQGVNGIPYAIVDGKNAVRCFLLSHSNAVIDGFTIMRGKTTGYDLDSAGGGVQLNGAGTVQNCRIYSNSAYYGGGVACRNGGLIRNCTITTNSANISGGGVFLDMAGEIQNCTIVSNAASSGGGTYCSDGGTVLQTWLFGNSASFGGGAYCDNGGTFRNCVLRNNSAMMGGAINVASSGTVQNCTIVSNSASLVAGGVESSPGSRIQNTVIYFNQAPFDGNYFHLNLFQPTNNDSYSFCCTTPLVQGPNNTAENPEFASVAGNDFHLLPGSPCVNAGTNESWMAGAQDLDGSSRIIQGIVDLGAYELNPTGGTLRCNAMADVQNGVAPLTVNFMAYASGTNTTLAWYGWDFNNDGAFDQQGPGLAVVSNLYFGSGWYSVSLCVSNAAGEGASITKTNYVQVGPAIAYVALGGSHLFPYTNWGTAATNLQAAVDAGVDGTLIRVTNGTYALTRQISVTKGITLRSVNGATNTVLDGGYPARTNRCVTLSHSNAVIEGFTITGGKVSGSWPLNSGAGVYIHEQGVVERCVIRQNTATGDGAGIFCDAGGTVRNCLLFYNVATSSGDGGGIYCLYGGIVQHCTITSNSAYSGGGVYCYAGGTIRNTIFYWNQATSGSYTNYNDPAAGDYAYCCTIPALTNGPGHITNDPQFISVTMTNYHLATNSFCIDAGSNGSVTNDLDGIPRPLEGNCDGNAAVDLGAYEIVHPSADTDQDGLTDNEELYVWFVNPLCADTDGDRMTDGDEILAGCNPRNPLSFFGLRQPAILNSGTGLVIRWSSETGKSYQVDRSTNLLLGFGDILSSNLTAIPPENTYTDTTVRERGPYFYRINLEPAE